MNQRSDSFWFLVLLVVFVAVVGLMLWDARDEQQNRKSQYSSFRSDRLGTRAFYLLSKQLGFQARRLKQSLALLPRKGRLLFIVQPHSLKKAEAKAMKRWVEAGHTIVIASSVDNAFYKELDVVLGWQPKAHTKAHSRLSKQPPPPPRKEDADHYNPHKLWTPGRVFFRSWPKGSKVLKCGGSLCRYARVIRADIGKGSVWMISSPKIFANQGLERKANVWFASNLLRMYAGGEPVFFDEYHHGYRFQRTLLMYIFHRGWGAAFLQALLGFMLFLWWSHSPAQRAKGKKDTQTWEGSHVIALAHLYEKAKATPHCANMLAWQLRFAMGERIGHRATRDAEKAFEALERAGVPEARRCVSLLIELESLADTPEPPDNHILLQYAAEVDTFLQSLSRKGVGERERAV